MPGLTALIPLDGSHLSESAFALLPFIKSLGFDTIQLVSVWEDVWDEEALAGDKSDSLRELAEKSHSYLDAYLKVQGERVLAQGFAVKTVVKIGRAAEEIVKAAIDDNVDLILVATHGRDGLLRWRLGSVADKIVRHASSPTLVIGPNVNIDLVPYSLKRILVPVDGSEMAEEALVIATGIAGKLGAELDLVWVISLLPVTNDPGMGTYTGDVLTVLEDAARAYLAKKEDDLRGKVKVTSSTLLGTAGELLLQHLATNKAELVVMESHGRSGVLRAALGSVTDRLLHGPAPVLVLRPELSGTGFLESTMRQA